jgi:hypothetical protein
MNKINLKLNIEEVNIIMQTLGQLASSTGVYPLLLDIKQQAEKQIQENNNAKDAS